MTTTNTDKNKSTVDSTKIVKVKKSDQALAIFKAHLPNREAKGEKAFRAAVVADFKKKIGITNVGTLGMYFSWADKQVTLRPKKEYNRVATRKPSKTAVDAEGKTEQANIAEAMNAWQKKTVGEAKDRIVASRADMIKAAAERVVVPAQKAARKA